MDIYYKHIKKHNLSHHIWLDNKVSGPIYRSLNKRIQVGKLDSYRGEILRVVEIKNVEKKTYHLIERDQKILGWAQLRFSPIVYRKPTEYVKIDLGAFIENQDDQKFVVQKENMKFLKSQMLESRYLMYKNGTIYEGVFKKRKLQAWFTKEVLIRSKEVRIPVTDMRKDISLWKYNNFSNKVDMRVRKTPMQIVRLFEDENLARVKTPSGMYWTRLDDLVIDSSMKPVFDLPYDYKETVIYDILYNAKRERRETQRFLKSLQTKQSVNMEVSTDEGSNRKDHGITKEVLEAEIEKEIEKQAELQNHYTNLKNSVLGRIYGFLSSKRRIKLKQRHQGHRKHDGRGER